MPAAFETAIVLAVLLALALLADWLTQRILRPLAVKLVTATRSQFDDALLERGVLSRLSHVVPALVVFQGVQLVPHLHGGLVNFVGKLALAYLMFTIARGVSAFLNAVNDQYSKRPHARSRPIKGYLQLLKIIIYVVAAIGIVAVMINRSPVALLTGLGALGAVMLLVFRDTILSLVASVQIASNDMVRVGDWIEMPSLGVDGEIVDIALHTIKVQNWDKTIVTVPTHRLIEDSVKNWRGMTDAGGRRIKRSLFLDQQSVRFLQADDIQSLRHFVLLDEYLQKKDGELAEFNADLGKKGLNARNSRQLTNLGTFRIYVQNYLRQHPGIHQQMTLMVRQLPPTATGLPLEIYCFTSDIRWERYEAIQSDIFDHLLAILPAFGLRVFQDISDAGSTLLPAALAACSSATTQPPAES
ncbi:mechanosensitive ion channel family protein [Pseudoxanthomonas dokdonensis]|uniref:Mechanosensitive ion channel protein MscS n=1 Tax=Pseudoxanthomonas dokdonensis TaxID=344882 RepID=A0A0R0CG93_9GAMM|nr:mechanosensitive ion channel family protein [Pseudoxanthomonas dokdonensis]KRG68400.1 mechanosensitive ion channel protein MscS [Pseudoxanthomonas dokdonensis]